MDACDSQCSLNSISPLATTAYDELWNAAANPALASFTQVAEICLDGSSPSFRAALLAAPSPGAHGGFSLNVAHNHVLTTTREPGRRPT